ncbi:hypothetical protein B0H19DRAFT_485217 [Mycena capillaripes]|nr:hypothetical protein B0H19DRAFT_485217 [Mycena capillaripes]
MYPMHIALASTSRSSSDVVDGDKAGPDALLTPTNAIRVIQLVEMPAPPRRSPPSSASASSSSSSSLASSSAGSDMDLDTEEQDEEDCDSYCSSAADGDDEEERAAQEAEASKVGRILAWRANIASASSLIPPSLSPTTPRPRLVPAPLSLSPTTPTRVGRKRSAASSTCSSSSAPRSKRSRTSSVHATAGPSEWSRMDASPSTPLEKPLFLAPPSPTTLARRHTSPRHQHQRHSSSPHPYPSALVSAPELYSPTTPTASHLHRTLSMSTSSQRETLCSACDRAFSSTRAFRVHALHSADADAGAACGAAVAYATEEVRAP